MFEWFKKNVTNAGKVKKQDEKIQELNTKVDTLKNENETLEKDNKLLNKSLDTLREDITDLEGKISLLESEKQNMSNTITELQKTQGQASNQFKSGNVKLTYIRLNGITQTFMVDRNENLSKNFKVYEFLCPGTNELILYEILVAIAQIIRDHYNKPVTITSGYRTKAFNDTLEGHAEDSPHLYGKAIDFQVSGVNKNDYLAYAKTISKYAYTNEANMKNAVHLNI